MPTLLSFQFYKLSQDNLKDDLVGSPANPLGCLPTRLAFLGKILGVFMFLGLTLFAQTPPTPKPVDKNLLFEGSFLEYTAETPVGWSAGGFAGGNHGNTSRVVPDSKGNYISLTIAKMESSNFVLNLNEPINLKPTWKKLLCSVDIRVFNFIQGSESYHKPRMHIVFLDESYKEITTLGVSLSTRYTDVWQTAEREVQIPINATMAKIWLGTLSSTGRLEFRNPYIAPIE